MLLHRKNDNREAQLQVAQGIGCSVRDIHRVGLYPEQEIGRDQQALERLLHAPFEAVLIPVGRVEGQQPRDLVIGHRAADTRAARARTVSASRTARRPLRSPAGT